MKNRPFNHDSPTLKILTLLKDSIPVGLDYKAIAHFLLNLKYPRMSIHNSLRILERSKYIVNFGRRKSKIYSITDRGLNRLYRIETRNDIKKIENYIFIYMGGLD
jgi:DNA-binding PadR family transcriptional regulator